MIKQKSWIFSRVEKDAKVYGNARVVDGSLISERAQVYGHALIELSVIAGDAHVCGYAHCSGCSTVIDDAEVYGNSVITKKATISGEAVVCGNSYIARATVTGSAKIKDKEIKSSKDYVYR